MRGSNLSDGDVATIRTYYDMMKRAPGINVAIPGRWNHDADMVIQAVFGFEDQIAIARLIGETVDLTNYIDLEATIVVVDGPAYLAGYIYSDEVDRDAPVVDVRDLSPIRDLLVEYDLPVMIRGNYCRACLGSRWRFAWKGGVSRWYCANCGRGPDY